MSKKIINNPNLNDSAYLTHLKYRSDIDGLRAIAVLLVVGFHAFPFWFPGGFIGVDLFFVISGFLISLIIIDSLGKSRFSFVEFYSRRIKRIFPALLLVLNFSFAFGWFLLLPEEYKQLGKHIAGGAGFFSNFLFWNEDGYFDNSSETKPLLHLWSLGVEEQFYIVWPLFLWLAWKRKLNLLISIITLAAISFVINISSMSSDAVATFYSPITRFWELIAGAVLAYMTLYKQHILPKLAYSHDILLRLIDGRLRSFQSVLGAILLVIGVLVVTRETHFPGWWAVLPTLGAVLIISAGTQAWLNRIILSNRVLVWFGLISYPLYLWHWPLLSFVRIIEGEMPSREVRIAAVVISIALAWLTYKLIEIPVRFGRRSGVKIVTLLLLMVLVGFVGYSVYKLDGFLFRDIAKSSQEYSKSIARSDKQRECFDIPYAYEKSDDWFCKLGEKLGHPKYFVYGDSHAFSLLPAIDKFGIENNINISFTAIGGCPPLLGIVSPSGESQKKYNCQKLNDRIFEYVKINKIKSVVLIARWTYYTGGTLRHGGHVPIWAVVEDATIKNSLKASFEYGLKYTVQKYRNIGVNVYIVEDNPMQIHDIKYVLKKSKPIDAAINKFSVTREEHENNQSYVAKQFKSIGGEMINIINFDNLLCTDQICPWVNEGKFLYFDEGHLSVDGAMLIYPSLKKNLLTSVRDN